MITYNEKTGNVTVTFELSGDAGPRLLMMQRALTLAVYEISSSERNAGDEDFKKAIWNLTQLQRVFMLDENQMQTGVGGRPFKNAAEGISSI